MTLSLEILLLAWPFQILFTGFVIFFVQRIFRAKLLGLNKLQIIGATIISGLFAFVSLPEWPGLIHQTIVEYQYRFEDGPDPETVFHFAEKEAKTRHTRSKHDTLWRALGGGPNASRRPREAPRNGPSPAPSDAASMGR